jgi:DNA-binding HxlR family transcriptional regulator
MHHSVTPMEPANIEECRRVGLPLSEVLARIAGKWTIFIVGALSKGPRRFSDLRREVAGISQKMLTVTLRDLEKDGFVTRTVTPTIPPRVDYELTEMGRELREPLNVIGGWALANRHRVEAARQSYLEREQEAAQSSW